MRKRLYRSQSNRMIGGICGGIAEYVNIDAAIMRILFVIGLFISFFTLALAYIAGLVIIPSEQEVR